MPTCRAHLTHTGKKGSTVTASIAILPHSICVISEELVGKQPAFIPQIIYSISLKYSEI